MGVMSGRHTKPLFELLRDEAAEGRRGIVRPPPPVEVPEIKPSRPTQAREGVSGGPAPGDIAFHPRAAPAREPEAVGETAISVRGGVVAMSVYAMYLCIAAVLAVAVVTWVVAYNSGRRAAERDLAARFQQDLPPGVTDPRTLVQAPRDPLREAVSGQDKSTPAEPSPGPKPSAATRQARPGDVLTAAGALTADPRTPKLNYQVLLYAIPTEEAADMVAFFGKNGLDVIGVPVRVDRPAPQDNNQPLYKVVVAQGLTSEQYKSNDPLRARQEAEVRRLGALWKMTKRGRTDLASTYWENLKP